ncbi:protease HtpX [Alkalihalobacillus sp. AL-G]|uniref:protease HtpX n=1 Tax=Alkalihalobacillus sp. AL-G TaxID=2926399 RepID=UPI00272C84A3|nr:protease HtpX [Alkalihalobacillus sp. AL-G]WLD94179.1 protease HtpX [Alkalihalobacillus sp. AL-G]
MAKRIFLFILTNVLVLTTIMVVLSLLGLNSYIDAATGNIQFGALLAFSAVIGFTGSFISLAISRWMAKKIMRVKVIDPNGSLNAYEQSLVDRVHRLARTAGLAHMPEVGIYNSPEVNAFATGPSKRRSLVAVSTGLLEQMDDDAVEGVVAHEIAHIANGDMVTMTLLQGVVNTFVVFLSRIAAWAVAQLVDEDKAAIVHILAIIVFQIAFSILGSIVIFAYSRYREYHADRGGADLAGKDKMIHALESLKAHVNRVDTRQETLASMKISGGKRKKLLFSTHPDLDERIRRLHAK